MREAVEEGDRRAKPHLFQRLDDPAAQVRPACEAVNGERLGNDVENGEAGIERLIRVLEDHLGLPPESQQLAASARQRFSQEADRAARRVHQLEDGKAGRGLAAAALADDAQHLARTELEADVVDGPHLLPTAARKQLCKQAGPDRKGLGEIAHFKDRAVRRSAHCINRCACCRAHVDAAAAASQVFSSRPA